MFMICLSLESGKCTCFVYKLSVFMKGDTIIGIIWTRSLQDELNLVWNWYGEIIA